VVAREASCGEQSGACTREGDRGEVSAKKTEKKGGTPVEAKVAVNDTKRRGAIERWRLPPWWRRRPRGRWRVRLLLGG
jgi:hypothetical protein